MKKNYIKNTTLPPRCFFQMLINNTNVEKFCTCFYILKICLWLEEAIN